MQGLTRLALTGGGTGGHVIPNIALIHELKGDDNKHGRGKDPDLLYIGSRNGMERQLMGELGITYKAIFTGKLRRYFSWRNVADLFLIMLGIVQSFSILLRWRPQVLFCKGGFVSFPPAVAAWILRIPVVLHESDVVPGLANKLCARLATKICVSFEESRRYFPAQKVVVTGNPVRQDIYKGDAKKGMAFVGFSAAHRPTILVMGGSQGAAILNTLVWENLAAWLERYQLVHICGSAHVKELEQSGYKAFAFIGDELKDVYALADAVVTRSGANTLAELDAVGKPAILIPLGKKASRGDQIENAQVYAESHNAVVVEEERLTSDVVFEALDGVLGSERLPSLRSGSRGSTSGTGGGAAQQIVSLLYSL